MKRNHYFDYVIGRALQTARKKGNKTKTEVYKRFNISRQTYDRYESGESSAPLPLVLDIFLYCGVSDWRELGEERMKELGNSGYGRTLLRWLHIKKED